MSEAEAEPDETNVVSLRGEPIYQTIQTPEVVEALEKYLEAARAGEIVGVTIGCQYRDETVGGQNAGLISYRLIGMIMQLVHDNCSRRREEKN